MTLKYKVGDRVMVRWGDGEMREGGIEYVDHADADGLAYRIRRGHRLDDYDWFREIEITMHLTTCADHDGKADAGKPPWHLLPWEALAGVVDTLAHGAKTYGPNTWQNVPNGQERYLGAMLRHIHAWKTGEQNDRESGLPHLAHVACNALFLLALSTKEGTR